MTKFYLIYCLTVQVSQCLYNLSLFNQVGLIVVLTCHGLLSAPLITKLCVCQLHEVLLLRNVKSCLLSVKKYGVLVVILKEPYDVMAFYFMYIYMFTYE